MVPANMAEASGPKAVEPDDGSRQARRIPTTRRRLTLVVVTAILPVLAFSAFLLAVYGNAESDRYLQQLVATTRAISQAIDADLARRDAILRVLQESPTLKSHDWRAFYDFAKVSVDPGASERIVLYDPSGLQLVSTMFPFGTHLPMSGMRDIVLRVATTATPAISGLFIGTLSREASLAVLRPVLEEGSVRYVLAYSFPPSDISRILQSQVIPPGRTEVVADSENRIIARTLRETELRGKPIAADLIAAIRGRTEGTYVIRSNLEGVATAGAFSKSLTSGWTVAFGSHRTILEAQFWRVLWLFGGGGAAFLAGGLVLALYQSRRITTPMRALAAMAEAMERGEFPAAQQLDLMEAAVAADRLRAAAENIRTQAEQRERAMAEINRRDHDLTVFQAIGAAAEKTLDPQQRLELLVNATCEALGFSGGGIWAADPTGATFRLRAGHNMPAEFAEISNVRSAAELPSIGLDGNLPQVLDVEAYPVPRLKRALKQDGYRTLVSISLKAEGEVVGALGLADRTVRQLTSDELTLLTAVGYQLGALLHQAELYAALQRELTERQKIQAGLEAANRELEGISYAMSHVLRAPLRAIEGFAAILLEDYAQGLDAECQRMLNAMRKNTMQMSRYLDDFLAFLRISRLPMQPEPVDMEALVRSILADKLAPGMAQQGDIAIEVGKLVPACGDRSLLERVWANLLDNAIKFTASRQDARIEVGSRAADTETVYYVRDNGVGFAAEYTAKLFGLFERLHGTEFPGTGMGLAIVHRIVTRHGGRVWAESKEGEGTTIYFALPATEAPSSLPDRVSQAEEATMGSR